MEEELSPSVARSRNVAAAALLIAITAAWLPWWMVRYSTTGIAQEVYSNRVFSPDPQVATLLPTVVTGVLVAVAVLWMFVRLAGRSFVYEPSVWARDLLAAAGLMIGAALSTAFWPASDFSFWSSQSYPISEGQTLTETTMPGIGWWLALASGLLFLISWYLVRQEPVEV